ncbi:hypothetical protein AB0M46_29220 [Dactylosporangium sp. NPDC051485]|uniref:hypothetical protein n=1 Tax=Dactylosporangium sp. NPDC051485 TaxID=3154846 RepID=UPI00342CD2D5
MTDSYRWPAQGPSDLRDGLTPRDVIDALHAPAALRMDNRVPPGRPTFLAVCAPTTAERRLVVVCTRDGDDVWTIVGAREAGLNERQMWRKHTS